MKKTGPPKKIGNTLIARTIVESGLDDVQFAEIAGVSVRTTRSWRTGEYSPTLKDYEDVVFRLSVYREAQTSDSTSVNASAAP